MKTEEQIIEESNNKTPEEIIELYNLTKESIRRYFSTLCFINKANRYYHYKLDIDIEGTTGLSELVVIKYLEVWEDSDIVYFKIGSNYTEPRIEELDNIPMDELIYIIKELNHI